MSFCNSGKLWRSSFGFDIWSPNRGMVIHNIYKTFSNPSARGRLAIGLEAFLGGSVEGVFGAFGVE
jgi:hypothetical protein